HLLRVRVAEALVGLWGCSRSDAIAGDLHGAWFGNGMPVASFNEVSRSASGARTARRSGRVLVQACLCTISTVRPECAATAAATLPRKTPARPLLPWEPSAIRLASRWSATRAIPFHVGASVSSRLSARKPAACASEAPCAAVCLAALL